MDEVIARQPTFKEGVCQSVSRRTRTWVDVQAEIVQRTGLGKEETSVVSERHLLLLNLKGDSEQGQYWLDGRRAEFIRRRPGSLLFIPAGCAWHGWEIGASRAAYLSISIDPSWGSQTYADTQRSALPSVAPELGFDDEIIMQAARGIGAEFDDASPLGAMVVEGYLTTIFAQLVRRTRHVRSVKKGGMSTSKLNRIIELIDADLTADLTLDQLAQVVGFSVPHLCRAFRQSVGCPPHTFTIRRRIERSQVYLRDTRLPLTDIALMCGFGNSSHFSNTFRRIVGTTPFAYRERWALGPSSPVPNCLPVHEP